MKKIFLPILFLFVFLEQALCFDMQAYIKQHSNQNWQVFLESFPYHEYLKTVDFADFQTIQRDRHFVWKFLSDAGGSKEADGFLYYLADNFLRQYPISVSQLDARISIGEAYLNPAKSFDNLSQPNLETNPAANVSVDEAYQIIGSYMLSKVAEKIKEEYLNKNFDTNDSINISYLNRLNKNKVFVSFEQSSVKKILSNLKQGKFEYLWGRFKLKAKPILCELGFFIWVLSGAFGVLLFLDIHYFFKLISFVLAFGLVASKLTTNCNKADSSQLSSTPNFKQIPLKSYFSINQTENLVDIYELKDNSGDLIGHSIWMKSPQVKAKYYAVSAMTQFENFKSTHSVVLATTGGYTTNFGSVKPDGFTMEDGELVNAVLLPDRQGLALFTNEGVRAIDLKSNIQLPNGAALESPFSSLFAYSKLLTWCKENKATVFQTHLLAYGDSILISPSKAPPRQRERRFLAFLSDKNGHVVHAIFDINAPYDLAVIAHEIFNIIVSRGLKVEGILNLDTGAYNILNVFDENGNLVPDVMGPVSISTATNLIIYYQ